MFWLERRVLSYNLPHLLYQRDFRQLHSILQNKTLQNQWLFWGVFSFFSYKLLSRAAHSGISIPHFDKIVHMGLFFILCFLLVSAYSMTRTQHFTLLAIYGALIEWLQALTGYRSGDVYDWIADVLGIVLLFVALDFWRVFTNKRQVRRHNKRQNKNG